MPNSLLIKGEIFKLVKSKSFLAVLSILSVIILISVWISWGSDENNNWKEQYQTEIANDLELISQETDHESIFVKKIENDIALKQYHLEANIPPSEDVSALGFVKKYSGITSFISIAIMIFASNMVTKEINWGTLKMLLMRPLSKSSILSSKYCALLLIGLGLYILVFIFLLMFGFLIYGFDNFTTKIVYFDNGIIEGSMLYELFKQYCLNYLLLVTYATIALLVSVVVSSSAISTSITLLIFVFGGTIAAYIDKYTWSKYIFFSNLDIANSHSNNGMPYFSVTVLMCYVIVFLVLSLIIFKRKEIDV